MLDLVGTPEDQFPCDVAQIKNALFKDHQEPTKLYSVLVEMKQDMTDVIENLYECDLPVCYICVME